MRYLPFIAFLLFAAAALAMLGRTSITGGGQYQKGSSLEHGEEGTSQARRYLEEVVKVPVATLARPIAHAQLPTNAVVFSVMPQLVSIAPRSERHHRGRHQDQDKVKKSDQDKQRGKDKPESRSPTQPNPSGDKEEHHRAGPQPANTPDDEDEDGPPQKVPEQPDHGVNLPLLSPAEEAWVEHGGRLVLAVDHARAGLDVIIDSAAPAAYKVIPELPGVAHINPHPARGLSGSGTLAAAPVFVCAHAPMIMLQRLGQGDVWLLGCPEVLTNQYLAEADHLALLTALAGGRPVFFDEFSHGADHDLGVSELLRRWNLGPALLVALVLVGCWYWRKRVIIGLVVDDWRDRRVEAVEGVDAIANLYYQALSARDCLHLYRSRLLEIIIARTGVKPTQARQILSRATDGLRLPEHASKRRLSDREFQLALSKLTHAFQEFANDRLR